MLEDKNKLIESLSPNERKVLPHIKEVTLTKISKTSELDKVSTRRALEYLQNKKILVLISEKKKIIDVGTNGALYRKKGLPERRLLTSLDEKRVLSLKEAQKISNLSEDEFKASLGALKRKALIELKNGKIYPNANKSEIAKKFLEELFLESLPLENETLTDEQKFALEELKKRKNIIEMRERTS